jgi:hypothetical protein
MAEIEIVTLNYDMMMIDTINRIGVISIQKEEVEMIIRLAKVIIGIATTNTDMIMFHL